jgi:hypothetical protein
MLRASYATGEVPPPLPALIDLQFTSAFSSARDPRRGNTFVSTGHPVLFKGQGSPDLETARASTFSVGAVLNPLGEAGPRLAVDYSRIRKSRDVYMLTEDLVLAHEDFWPERVTREPLTDADRALGYTGGRITMVDSRALNAAGRRVETIDASVDWPIALFGGRLHAYGVATWQLHNVQQGLFVPDVELASYQNGPLRWRANGGADWSRGSLTIGANLQYFGRYRVYPTQLVPFLEDQLAGIQGSRWVRPQAYLDLFASWRLPVIGGVSNHDVRLDVGLVNVLDAPPPRESAFAVSSAGYSLYGDPRRRRVEVVLSSSF